MIGYTSFTIIYNPKSTGSGKKMAYDLREAVQKALPHQAVECVPTQYAGHAEELAYQLASATERALVVSASGDGGYHEVVNGLLRARRDKDTQPVAGLLPAGNANDHYHSVHTDGVIKALKKGKTTQLDVLTLTTKKDGQPLNRYGHSYIGLGLTPKIGNELNKTKLDTLKEVFISLKILVTFRPVELLVDGHKQRYDSLVFSNIERMAKVLTLAKKPTHKRGYFVMNVSKKQNRLALIAKLLKTAVINADGGEYRHSFTFKTVQPTLLQIDGEVVQLEADRQVAIGIEPAALECVV